MLSFIFGIWLISRLLRPRWGWRRYYCRPFGGWLWLPVLALLFGGGERRPRHEHHEYHGHEGPFGFGGDGGWS